MADIRPSITAALEAFGLPAAVTVPGGLPVETVAAWLPNTTAEVPQGGEFRRAEARRVLVLPLADVPQLPEGTLIEVAEYDGGETKTWKYDGTEHVEHDARRAVVREVSSGS